FTLINGMDVRVMAGTVEAVKSCVVHGSGGENLIFEISLQFRSGDVVYITEINVNSELEGRYIDTRLLEALNGIFDKTGFENIPIKCTALHYRYLYWFFKYYGGDIDWKKGQSGLGFERSEKWPVALRELDVIDDEKYQEATLEDFTADAALSLLSEAFTKEFHDRKVNFLGYLIYKFEQYGKLRVEIDKLEKALEVLERTSSIDAEFNAGRSKLRHRFDALTRKELDLSREARTGLGDTRYRRYRDKDDWDSRPLAIKVDELKEIALSLYMKCAESSPDFEYDPASKNDRAGMLKHASRLYCDGTDLVFLTGIIPDKPATGPQDSDTRPPPSRTPRSAMALDPLGDFVVMLNDLYVHSSQWIDNLDITSILPIMPFFTGTTRENQRSKVIPRGKPKTARDRKVKSEKEDLVGRMASTLRDRHEAIKQRQGALETKEAAYEEEQKRKKIAELGGVVREATAKRYQEAIDNIWRVLEEGDFDEARRMLVNLSKFTSLGDHVAAQIAELENEIEEIEKEAREEVEATEAAEQAQVEATKVAEEAFEQGKALLEEDEDPREAREAFYDAQVLGLDVDKWIAACDEKIWEAGEEGDQALSEGWAYFHARDYRKAVEAFQEALELGNKDARRALANCYYKMGNTRYKSRNYKGALECFKKAQEYGHRNAAKMIGVVRDISGGIDNGDQHFQTEKRRRRGKDGQFEEEDKKNPQYMIRTLYASEYRDAPFTIAKYLKLWHEKNREETKSETAARDDRKKAQNKNWIIPAGKDEDGRSDLYKLTRKGRNEARLIIAQEMMADLDLAPDLSKEENLAIAKILAHKYLEVVVNEDELHDFLVEFKESGRPISELELFLQEDILDYLHDHFTDLASKAEAGTLLKAKKVHEVYMAGARAFEFPLIRDLIVKRKTLLAYFILMHIRLPEDIGSSVRGKEAKKVVLYELFKSEQREIFQPALETMIEMLVREHEIGEDGQVQETEQRILNDYFFERFYPVLVKSGEFPRFEEAIIDILIKSKNNDVVFYEIEDDQRFFAGTKEIIKLLARESALHRLKFIEYLHEKQTEEPLLVEELLIELGYRGESIDVPQPSNASPYNIMQILRTIRREATVEEAQWASAEDVRKRTENRLHDEENLSIQTVRRALGTLVTLDLVEKKGSGEDAIFRAADPSPPGWEKPLPVLGALGTRPTSKERPPVWSRVFKDTEESLSGNLKIFIEQHMPDRFTDRFSSFESLCEPRTLCFKRQDIALYAETILDNPILYDMERTLKLARQNRFFNGGKVVLYVKEKRNEKKAQALQAYMQDILGDEATVSILGRWQAGDEKKLLADNPLKEVEWVASRARARAGANNLVAIIRGNGLSWTDAFADYNLEIPLIIVNDNVKGVFSFAEALALAIQTSKENLTGEKKNSWIRCLNPIGIISQEMYKEYELYRDEILTRA
ncbi:MAG: sel1 repeat family protein, partial [Candidatus Omnitrophica bacterium]|nr:sel1 repeat family protein [Candidatus Omnitrophota bacterium]